MHAEIILSDAKYKTEILFSDVGWQERDVKFFTETEENNAMMAPRAGVPYFL